MIILYILIAIIIIQYLMVIFVLASEEIDQLIETKLEFLCWIIPLGILCIIYFALKRYYDDLDDGNENLFI